MSDTERHAYDEHLNAIMIQNDVLTNAKLEGRAEGRAEGIVEGEVRGEVKGRAKEKNANVCTAYSLDLHQLMI